MLAALDAVGVGKLVQQLPGTPTGQYGFYQFGLTHLDAWGGAPPPDDPLYTWDGSAFVVPTVAERSRSLDSRHVCLSGQVRAAVEPGGPPGSSSYLAPVTTTSPWETTALVYFVLPIP